MLKKKQHPQITLIFQEQSCHTTFAVAGVIDASSLTIGDA